MVAIVEKRSVLRLDAESTYKVAPTFTDADTIYAESIKIVDPVDAIAREGDTAGAPGWESVPGLIKPSCAFDFEFTGVRADNANPVTARPLWHKIMTNLCGFDVAVTTAGQLVYTRAEKNHGSAGLQFYEIDKGGSSKHLATLLGARADLTIKWERGGRLMGSVSGNPATISQEDSSTSLTPVYQGTDFISGSLAAAARLPVKGKGLECALSGGGLTYPTSGDFGHVNFEARLKNNPVVVYKGDGTDEIQEVLLITQAPEVDFTVHAVDYATWNPKTLKNNRSRITASWSFPAPDSPAGATDSILIPLTLVVEDYEEVFVDGRKCWKHKCKAVWSTAGVPSALFTLKAVSTY